MTSYPRSPRLLKADLVLLDPATATPGRTIEWGQAGQALWDPHDFRLILSHRGSVSAGFHGTVDGREQISQS
jgi:hypothetical protein